MKKLLQILDISKIERITFRNDINGLRAIAVLAVVLYHADIEIFKGGWLGVDLFFVISGYLISNIIISELNQESFTLKNFYLRRVNRILPGLFSTLLLTTSFAYFFLTPKATKEFADSVLASIFFYANLYFQKLDFYVAESTNLMPLLHTWSLAIEEQFYLIFPLAAFLLYKYIKDYFTLFISLLSIISIYINSLTFDYVKFYQLQFRIWELLFGVLVMVVSNNFKIKHLEKLGFLLMLIPMFYFNDEWINEIEPKLIALIGISLIIFSNDRETFLTKLLSLKPLAIVGLSSYSIYLLHQPIFAFFRIYYTQINWQNLTDSRLNYFEIFIALIVTLILGAVNYFFVEKYFLKEKKYKIIFLLFIATLLSNLFIRSVERNNRISIESKPYQYTINIENFTPFLDNQNCYNISSIEEICSFNKEGIQKVILLGDSQSREIGYLLSKNLSKYNLEVLIGDACLFLLDTKYSERCSLFKNDKELKDYVLNHENTIFIYVGDIWDKNNYKINFETSIPFTFEKLLSNDNKIIVIEQIPNFPFNVVDKLISNNLKDNFIGIDYSYWIDQKEINPQLNIYKNIKSQNIYFINPEDYLCNSIVKNYCVGAIENQLFFRDENHLTVDGVGLFLDDLIELIFLIATTEETW